MYIDPAYDWVVIMARLQPGVTRLQAQAAAEGPFYDWGRTAKPQLRLEDIPTLVVRDGAGGLDSLRRQYSKPLNILLSLVVLHPRNPPARTLPTCFWPAQRRAGAKLRCG